MAFTAAQRTLIYEILGLMEEYRSVHPEPR